MEIVFSIQIQHLEYFYMQYINIYISRSQKSCKKIKGCQKKEITEVVALAKKYAQLLINTKVFTKIAHPVFCELLTFSSC